MKYILYTLLSIIVYNSNAQTPDYFNANQEWQLSSSFWDGSSPCGTNTSYTYFIGGDTIIDNTLYKKLNRKYHTTEFYMSGQQGDCEDEVTGEENYRFVRQSGDSIFWKDPFSQGQDSLMISYNLEVGDTATNTNLVMGTNVVQKIDSINLNGYYHRVFYTDTTENNYILEGIGHFTENNFHGEFVEWWVNGIEYNPTLLCYAQNGNTIWVNPSYSGNCSYLNDLSIQSNSQVTYEEKKAELIKIIDMTGRETKDQPNTILIHIYSDGTTKKIFRSE